MGALHVRLLFWRLAWDRLIVKNGIAWSKGGGQAKALLIVPSVPGSFCYHTQPTKTSPGEQGLITVA